MKSIAIASIALVATLALPPLVAHAAENPVEKPGPSNTGPTDATTLKPMLGETVTEEGAVIENVRITGQLTIAADDVTVRNFILDADGAFYGIKIANGSTGVKIEHGEITNAKSALILGTGFTATALNIHEGFADGLKVQGEGGPTLVERCWIHHIGKSEGAHADGNQSVGVSGVTFRQNFFDLPITAPEPYKQNACFILQTKTGPVSNFVIDKNWLNGGGWVLYIPEDGTDIHITDNIFGRDFRFGVMSGDTEYFSGNVWEDTGEPVNAGDNRKNLGM